MERGERADTRRAVALSQKWEGESVQRAPGGSTEEESEAGLHRGGGSVRKPWQQSLQTLVAMKMHVRALEVATASCSDLQSAGSA